ncbi:MAG TPA: T9SS type A sorting domain-containing protein [Parafilimonas sp.]|nr:T9SS type A sorting domain-containing protein [Parafilimonas sp.]
MLTKLSVLVILTCFIFSAATTAQIKDSILFESKENSVWKKSELDIITRNDGCAFVSVLQLRWNENAHTWINAFLNTYDSVQGMGRTVTQSWDTLKNTWVNYYRAFMTYRKEESQFVYQYQTWDAVSGLWINNYRFIETRDNESRTIVSEGDIYSDNAWQKQQRNLLSFDADNSISLSIFQIWNNGWINNNKTVYDYSSGLTLYYSWDPGNMKWTKYSRTINDYLDSTTLAEKALTQNYLGSSWQNAYRYAATYNDNDQQLSGFQQFWDLNTQAWINSSKTKMDYYEDGSQNRFLFEAWDVSSNSWAYGARSKSTDVSCSENIQLVPVTQMKHEMGAIVQNNKTGLLHLAPGANTIAGKGIERRFNPVASDRNKLVYDFSFNGDASKQNAFELVLSFAKRTQKVSSQAKGDVIAKNNAGFMVSPNPAKNYFDVNLSAYKNAGSITLKLSDISGKTILRQKMNAGVQRVHLPSLQKGMYIVTIISGKQSQNQKLIIE